MKGQKAQKGTLKKVLHYIRPYWALVGLSVLLAAVTWRPACTSPF